MGLGKGEGDEEEEGSAGEADGGGARGERRVCARDGGVCRQPEDHRRAVAARGQRGRVEDPAVVEHEGRLLHEVVQQLEVERLELRPLGEHHERVRAGRGRVRVARERARSLLALLRIESV